jgi:hypothetical protein
LLKKIRVTLRATGRATGALPLLSFLLDQLWRRRTADGLLTFAAYDDLGGLEGAIGRRAEEAFRDQPDAVRSELVALLRALVTVRAGTLTSRSAPLARFPDGSPLRLLVDTFLLPPDNHNDVVGFRLCQDCYPLNGCRCPKAPAVRSALRWKAPSKRAKTGVESRRRTARGRTWWPSPGRSYRSIATELECYARDQEVRTTSWRYAMTCIAAEIG